MKKHEKSNRPTTSHGDIEPQQKLELSDGADSMLPLPVRNKLYDLFGQIEREFETLYAENVTLSNQIDVLKEKLVQATGSSKDIEGLDGADTVKVSKKSHFPGGSQISQRLKMTYKQQTSRLVSSFRQFNTSCHAVRHFHGHRDGVWDISSCKTDGQVVATASADHSAKVWWIQNGSCLVNYLGHSGSVNSIRFHPSQEIVVTGSGDHTAHIWRAHASKPAFSDGLAHKGISSEEEPEGSEREDIADDSTDECRGLQAPLTSIRQPAVSLLGHSGVVIAADWLGGGSHVVTASWDRTANLYDAETGELVQTLTGHDLELTNVCGHPQQKLAVTSSKDTTFRLWEFRDPSMKVNVFQGHTQPVTSAVFAGPDRLVSGSDDRTCKVWDLRNMRSPLTTIRTDSPVNRLAVHTSLQRIAIPQDNRHIRVYDYGGERLLRLPRSSRQGHTRMVCAVSWVEKDNSLANLFSCGFDRQVIAWQVNIQSKDKE